MVARFVRSVLAASLVAASVGVFLSCEPCAGTAACGSAPHLDVAGQILDRATTKGAPGVRIEVRESGKNNVLGTTVTDDVGHWRVASDVTAPGDSLRIDVSVIAPGAAGYTVQGVAVRASTTQGDAVELGQWLSQPSSRLLLTLQRRGVPLAGAFVTFTRTGGVQATVAQEHGFTNGVGVFDVELDGASIGKVIGTLQVRHSSFASDTTLTNVALELGYKFQLPYPSGSVGIGGQLVYNGSVISRGSGEPVTGARVTFTRTGGIALSSPVVTAITGNNGFFTLPLQSSVDGVVIGDVVVAPPGDGKATTYRDVQFATYDSLFTRNSGLWAFGERWLWSLEVWRNDRLVPVAGIRTEFRRVGGIAITPSTFTQVTNASGRIDLGAAVQDTGFVDGELTVFPADGPARVIKAIHLRTFEGDTRQFGGVVGFGPALRYEIDVLRTDGTAVGGASVEWTQTSGAPASPAVLRVTTDPVGRADLTLIPSADSDVGGTIRVIPGPPWADGTAFTFTGLRLPTFEGGEIRFGVVYRIPPP